MYDLITIGGGFTGLTAALRASELGLRCAVLERSTDERYLCNSRVATGAFVVMGKPISLAPESIFDTIMARTDGLAKEPLARAVAGNVARARDWLRSHGAKFINIPAFKGDAIMAPPRRLRPGLDWEGRGPDALMQAMERKLVHFGGRVLRGVEVKSLLMQHGACTGVQAIDGGRAIVLEARATVVADGGFQANMEMVREHICRKPERLVLRACPSATGDGIRMAAAVGAAIGGFGGFYGHLQHRDARTNARLWPYPQLDAIAEAAILVRHDGLRFADEGTGGVALANAVAQLDDPLGATLIFDDRLWQGSGGRAFPVPANPGLAVAGAGPISADTVEDLARKAGIDPKGLGATITAHNAAVASGDFSGLLPSRTVGAGGVTSSVAGSRGASAPAPIATAPFHAIPLCAGLTLTFGGIRIDERARALREDGSPIAGLFAAGTPVAGLDGGSMAGYVGGFAKAFTLGLIAAETAAGDTRSNNSRSTP